MARPLIKDLQEEIKTLEFVRVQYIEIITEKAVALREIGDENARLTKKLEALEASLDVIAMAATAGLAVTEL